MAENKINTEQLDLERALSRLDEVVAAISAEGVELERAMSLYEEGVGLVKLCASRLEDARRKISVLRMSDSGEVTEVPFDAVAADGE